MELYVDNVKFYSRIKSGNQIHCAYQIKTKVVQRRSIAINRISVMCCYVVLKLWRGLQGSKFSLPSYSRQNSSVSSISSVVYSEFVVLSICSSIVGRIFILSNNVKNIDISSLLICNFTMALSNLLIFFVIAALLQTVKDFNRPMSNLSVCHFTNFRI